MGQNAPSGNSRSSSVPIIPKYLQGIKPSEGLGLAQELSAQGALPSIADLYGMIPDQGVAALTPDQLNTIQQYESFGTGGPNAPQSTGIGTLNQYATGTPGNSPATQAAEQKFGQITGPQIQQQASLQGQGNSGAALEANAIGNTSTIAPFLEQDQANQLNAASGLIGAGTTLNEQQLNDMSAKLQAEGIPQQQAQQILTNLYNQQQQQVNYASGVQQEPLSAIPSLLGQSSVNVGTGRTSPSK